MFNKLRTWQGGFGWSRHHGIVSPAYFVCRPGAGLHARFADYLFHAKPYLAELTRVSKWQPPSQFDTPWEQLRLVPLLVPPVAEQTRIADVLDRESKGIGAIRVLLAEHRKAGIELERRVIDDLFAEVPLTRLGWRASIQTGLTLGGKYVGEELVEYPYLRVANVQADAIATADVATVRVPARLAKRTTLRPGDVLMTEGGDIDKLGRGAVWDGSIADCLHQNHVFAVRCGDRLLPDFLAVWTRSSVARSFFERTASRITNIASTNLTKLVRLPVPDLPVADQRATLRAFDREHHRITELRDQTMQLATGLAEYRDALITEAVTGKLNARQLSVQWLDESGRGVAEGTQPEILPA